MLKGYETAKDYSGADLVVVNTCGFIDSAVEESLSAIGEALAENGKVIVTGCLGARKNADGSLILFRVFTPKSLPLLGRTLLMKVMQAIHLHLPKPHDPFTDLVPPAGVKLTPKHYAYLEDYRRLQSSLYFLHHPKLCAVIWFHVQLVKYC